MLDPDLNDKRVRIVIGTMASSDRRLSQNAEFVWDALTAGEGPEMVSQAGLQRWLWHYLPKRSLGESDRWFDAAAAGAELFDRLSAPRYAEICRSDVTRSIFEAWDRSRDHGVAAAREAEDAAGVEPPDLDDFSWGGVFGTWESNARVVVEHALEVAIETGELSPASPRWRNVARRITKAELDTAHPDGIGQSWRSLVTTERADLWASGAAVSDEERTRRRALVNRFLSAPPDPSAQAAASILAPLIWLAELCDGGAKLTASHYLAPAAVREAVDRFGWSDQVIASRRESDVREVQLLRVMARDLGVVRRRKQELHTTVKGRTLIDDPARWWRPFVDEVAGTDDYAAAVSETLSLWLLDAADLGHEAVVERDLVDGSARTLGRQPWANASGRVHAHQHLRAVKRTLHQWETWNLAETIHPALGQDEAMVPRVALTSAGQRALTQWLHRRITGPQHPI